MDRAGDCCVVHMVRAIALPNRAGREQGGREGGREGGKGFPDRLSFKCKTQWKACAWRQAASRRSNCDNGHILRIALRSRSIRVTEGLDLTHSFHGTTPTFPDTEK
jgi:hypothetical protein